MTTKSVTFSYGCVFFPRMCGLHKAAFPNAVCLLPTLGKPKVELTYDKMYTVTSRLSFTVSKEDDGVPVACIVDHPAVKDFQAQKFLEVQCKYCGA